MIKEFPEILKYFIDITHFIFRFPSLTNVFTGTLHTRTKCISYLEIFKTLLYSFLQLFIYQKIKISTTSCNRHLRKAKKYIVT